MNIAIQMHIKMYTYIASIKFNTASLTVYLICGCVFTSYDIRTGSYIHPSMTYTNISQHLAVPSRHFRNYNQGDRRSRDPLAPNPPNGGSQTIPGTGGRALKRFLRFCFRYIECQYCDRLHCTRQFR